MGTTSTDLRMADSSGVKSPAADLPPNIRLGGLGRRFVGWLIDWLPLPILVIAPGVLVLGDGPADVLLVVLGAVTILAIGWAWVSVWMLAHRLGTPGMRAMRLQALRPQTGRPLGWRRALLRQLVFVVLGVTLLGGLVSLIAMARSPRRQGLHDRAADDVVIDERKQYETQPATLLPLDPQSPTPEQAAPDPVDSRAVGSSAMIGEADHWRAPETPTDERTNDEPAVVGDEREDGADEQPVNPFARPAPPGSAPTTLMAAIPSEPDLEISALPAAPALPDSEAAPAAPADRPRSGARWLVDLGGGRIVPLRRVLLIGRNPQAALGEDADVVGVGVHAAAVSKTHLALGWDEDGPWVMDRGSTNGTTLSDEAGTVERCAPNEKVRVRKGQTVSYGGQQLQVHRG